MSEEPICERCGKFIDGCVCRCPYCGETVLCDCCCGRNSVTGG